MAVPICEHMKASGKRCGSPALRDKPFCFYHLVQEASLPLLRNMYIAYNPKAAPGEWPILEFPTPALEDAAAIQIGFMQVLHGVANGNLDVRKAGRMLSALHGAAANLHRLETCLAQMAGKPRRKRAAGLKPARKRTRPSQTALTRDVGTELPSQGSQETGVLRLRSAPPHFAQDDIQEEAAPPRHDIL